MTEYKRVPLCVEVRYYKEGVFKPTNIIFDDRTYAIDKIYSVKKHCPQTVGCISPTEYCVSIEGVEKKIYFETDTNSWFSIREIRR